MRGIKNKFKWKSSKMKENEGESSKVPVGIKDKQAGLRKMKGNQVKSHWESSKIKGIKENEGKPSKVISGT